MSEGQPMPPANYDYEHGTEIGAVLNAASDIAHRLSSLQHEVDHDKKTGLYGENKWKQELGDSIETIKPGETVDVFVGDINGFKLVNDTLGHDAGDELLQIAGAAISQAFSREVLAHGNREPQDEDSIARLGGDEFAAFSKSKPSINPNHVQREQDIDTNVKIQSERTNSVFAKLIAGTKFEGTDVSISFGGARFDPSIDKSATDVFVRADAAMFAAKYQGKQDRITPEDKDRLRIIIPYLESKGARVDGWIKEAVYAETILKPEA